MDSETNSSSKKVQFNFVNLLAIIIVLLCFGFFFWICSPQRQEENRNIGEVKTALIGVLTLIMGYFFGASKGSAAKDVKIEELQQAANQPTTAEVINTKNISGNVTTDNINKTDK